MICMVFGFGGVKNIKARILIEPLNIDQSKLDTTFPESDWPHSHFLDLLYNPSYNSTTKFDITFNNTDTEHGTIYLGAKNTSAVESYLASTETLRTSESNTLVDTIRTAYNTRPDLVLCTPSMDPGGESYSCDTDGTINMSIDSDNKMSVSTNSSNLVVATNANDKSNITKILNSTSSKDFLLVLDAIKSLYPTVYKKFFNSAAALPSSQFDFNKDFQKEIGGRLSLFMFNYYMTSLQNHIADDNTPEGIIIKKRIKEIIDISQNNSPSLTTGFTLDANGTSWPIVGDSDVKNRTWNAEKVFPALPWTGISQDPQGDIANLPSQVGTEPIKPSCTGKGFWGAMNSDDCSVAAYIVNSIIMGVAQLFGIILGWIGALFNWIFDFSILNFHSWVENSKAVDIYKTVILAFIASLMLPLVFYLIMRMLIDKIDNDSSKMEKLLPKVLITALFIYFSFGIAGWLVDQSNIVTIYTYRSIHGGDTSQNLGDVIQRTLGINKSDSGNIQNTAKDSMGDWSTVAYTFGQLIINIVGLYVIFQAMILIFARSIVLLLCLIFSPIMVLPDGLPGKIGEIITKYRGTVMTYFTNNLLLAPIFMFLMMLAIRIGNISGDLIKTNSELDAATAGQPGFLAGIIKTIIVVVVMQLAITVAKNLSGEVGGTISGAVSSFTGGVVSGATKAFNRIRGNRQINTTSNTGSGNAAENPWQNNNTQNRRPIPLQTAQSSVIAPTGQKPSIQPDTKRRSLAGYQAISNQRNKSAANRNSVQQKATQNNRSVAAQTQVNNDRIQRKLSENKAKVQKENLKKYTGTSSNIKTGQITKRGADGKFQTISTELKTESKNQMTNKVSSENKLRDQAKNNKNKGGGNSGTPELSNSTVTGNPPTLNLSGAGGARQQIPLNTNRKATTLSSLAEPIKPGGFKNFQTNMKLSKLGANLQDQANLPAQNELKERLKEKFGKK